jgi:hypothetical protein
MPCDVTRDEQTRATLLAAAARRDEGTAPVASEAKQDEAEADAVANASRQQTEEAAAVSRHRRAEAREQGEREAEQDWATMSRREWTGE